MYMSLISLLQEQNELVSRWSKKVAHHRQEASEQRLRLGADVVFEADTNNACQQSVCSVEYKVTNFLTDENTS